MEKQSSAVPAIDKMDLIFDLMANTQIGLSQAVISSELKLPKATVSRMINRLTELGYLEQNQDNGLYNLGAKLLTLGNLVNKRLDISVIASSHLKELSEKIDEMVKLSIFRGDTVYPLKSIESRKAVRITQDSGTIFPPYIGAAGKLLLALSEEGAAYISNVLPHQDLRAYTPYTITHIEQLETVLQEIRVTGIAYDKQEESEGIYAIAMAVKKGTGETVAAVSIPFFGDFEVKIQKYKPLLKRCVDNISRSMGYLIGDMK